MSYYDSNGQPKKKGGFSDINRSYKPDAWRKDIPYNKTYDSHIWDWSDKYDKDGDGYRDGSVGDGGLWDD